jgi:hypothetical protein
MTRYGWLLLALALPAPSGPAGAETLPEGLEPAAFWSFNDCGTTDPEEDKDPGMIRDASARAYHLTLDGASCAPGRYGKGARFDGVDDIAVTAEKVLNFTDRLTVSAWVKPDRLAGVQNIVNKWYFMDSYALSLREDRFVFTVAREGGPWGTTVDVESSQAARLGAWQHVAGVFNGPAWRAEIWVDGQRTGRADDLGWDQLQPSDRPVALGSHPPWSAFKGVIDEVGLYNAALTGRQIGSLAGRFRTVYHGGDSSTTPVNDQYPNGRENGYDFYIGRLGKGLGTCRIREFYGRDILSRINDEPECCFAKEGDPQCSAQEAKKCKCLFQYEAAEIARPERTYAYWWLFGPKERGSREPFDYGLSQAQQFLSRRRKYGHLIEGVTLFADVERSIEDPGSEGWLVCRDPGSGERDPEACRDNRAVLDGFLDGIMAENDLPGVYTRPNIWEELFDRDYVPRSADGRPIRFVLWLTGCGTRESPAKPRNAYEIARDLPTVLKSALGGMQAVLWQHHIDSPDLDATKQRPSRTFFPVAVSRGPGYQVSCPE